MSITDYRSLYLGGVEIQVYSIRLSQKGWTMNSLIYDRTEIRSEYSTRSIHYLGIF